MEENEKVWKCLHCLFMKKDPYHGNMRVCFFGGKNVPVEPGNLACCNFHPSRRAIALDKYRDRVEAGIVGNRPAKKKGPDKKITAKEMLKRLQNHLVTKQDEDFTVNRRSSLPIIEANDVHAIPKEERTSAFKEQMCAGRCCKRKYVCKHYQSWLEHGKPQNAMKMISSISYCVNDKDSGGALLRYSRFLPLDGMSEDDVKEYQDVITF